MSASHVHDCTGQDMTCPCGYVFTVPRYCVSIKVTDGRVLLINEGFNCSNLKAAVAALKRAIERLEAVA